MSFDNIIKSFFCDFLSFMHVMEHTNSFIFSGIVAECLTSFSCFLNIATVTLAAWTGLFFSETKQAPSPHCKFLNFTPSKTLWHPFWAFNQIVSYFLFKHLLLFFSVSGSALLDSHTKPVKTLNAIWISCFFQEIWYILCANFLLKSF